MRSIEWSLIASRVLLKGWEGVRAYFLLEEREKGIRPHQDQVADTPVSVHQQERAGAPFPDSSLAHVL